MSDEPSTGAGHVPSTVQLGTARTALLNGFEARTMVFSPGSAGQVSLSATTPPVLVMTRLAGARAGNCGTAGGASTAAWPKFVKVALILTKSWRPVRGPLWPRRVRESCSEAAVFQASCWAVVSAWK